MSEKRYHYKMTIIYEGTRYGGWQIQPNTMTVQQTLQDTLKIFIPCELNIAGSGRTDAGAHALGQVAHFSVDHPLNCFRFLSSANGLLPKDIQIISIEEVDESFHARFSAKGKIYHYHIHLESVMNPFKRERSFHVPPPFDREKLMNAKEYLIGTHDFTSFANEPQSGSVAKNPVRTITRIDVCDEDGGLRLEFEGNGFLYKMVRNMVGTLVEVCKSPLGPEEISKILAARDRRRAGKAAPAKGLFLVKVLY